jgi:Zn-dependent M28 family amino/carboxypeptidase
MRLSAYPVTASILALLLLTVSCKNKASKNPDANKKAVVETSPLDSATLIHDLAALTTEAMAGRETGTSGNQLAREYIAKRYDSLQLKAPDSGRFQAFPFILKQNPAIKGTNIIAMIPGSTYRDQYYVISAHYDHLGVRNGQIYYGTDDNASGSACLLALAAYFKQHPPKHSFILASFDAEEKGLVGSRYFVAHPPVDSSKIVLNVNMDMVGRNDKNEIYASGTYHYPFLKKYVDSIQTMTTVHVLTGHDNPAQGHDDWTNQSDHYPFHLSHIPFLYFGVEDHPDYHKPTDTFDKVDKGFYFRVCNMIKETIVLLDKQEKLR